MLWILMEDDKPQVGFTSWEELTYYLKRYKPGQYEVYCIPIFETVPNAVVGSGG
jgi:hypothetical protein